MQHLENKNVLNMKNMFFPTQHMVGAQLHMLYVHPHYLQQTYLLSKDVFLIFLGNQQPYNTATNRTKSNMKKMYQYLVFIYVQNENSQEAA